VKKPDPYRPRFFKIEADIFKVDVGVAVNLKQHDLMRKVRRLCSDEAMLQELREESEGWDSAKCGEGRMCKMGGGFIVLLRAEKIGFCTFSALIVHEMVHVTQYLLRDRRIPLVQDTEEIHAYLTEHLVEKALKRVYL
jgi:hypothetical protein